MALNFDQSRDGIKPGSGTLTINSTGSLIIPVGNNAQRPSPLPGQIRFNTVSRSLEVSDGTNWQPVDGGSIQSTNRTTYILTQPTPGLVVPGEKEGVLYFVTDSIERMNIDDEGNLLFGESLDKFTVDFIEGNTFISGRLDVNGQSSLASANVEDLTSNRVVLAGINGELRDVEQFTYVLTDILDPDDGVTVIDQILTVNIDDDLNVDRQAYLASAAVEDLTETRVVYTGVDGELVDDAGFTYTGSNETGLLQLAGSLDVDVQATLASANIEDLTNNRVVIVGINGELEDDSNFTFDGTTFVVGTGDPNSFTVDVASGATYIKTTLETDGQATLYSANIEDLTSSRIVLVGTDGELQDSGQFTYIQGENVIDVDIVGSISIDNIDIDGNDISSTNENGNVTISTNGTGILQVNADTKINSTGYLLPSSGTSSQRPTNPVGGEIRFNTDNQILEGYNLSLTRWESLFGGVRDIDNDTYIIAETNAGDDNDDLDFYTAGIHRLQIDENGNLLFGDGLNKFTIDFADGSTFISGTLEVDGQSTLASANIEDLTETRVVYSGLGGELVDDIGFTYTGSDADGLLQLTGSLDVDVQATLASANIEDLTNNRIVIVGVEGELEDDANFTFDGTTFVVGTGDDTVTPEIVDSFTVDVSTGNVFSKGNLTVNGSTILGDDNTVDTTEFKSRISSNFTPNVTDTYTLGELGLAWKDLHLSESLVFEGASGENIIKIPTNLPGALDIVDTASNVILNIKTTTGSQKVTINPDLDVGGNVIITGDLTVNGTTTTVNSTTTTVVDPIMTIGGGIDGAAPTVDDNKDRGIAFQWHDGTDAKIGFFGYDDSDEVFSFIPDATIVNEVVEGPLGRFAMGEVLAGSGNVGGIGIGPGVGGAGTGEIITNDRTKQITDVTHADPVVITTATDHDFIDTQPVFIASISGISELNGNSYYAKVLTPTTLELYLDSALTVSIDGTQFGVRDIVGGTFANPAVITTRENHDYIDGQQVTISDVTSTMIELNDTYFIKRLSDDQFEIYSDAGLTAGIDSTGFTETLQAISNVTKSNPATVTTSTPHGYTTEQQVSIDGVGGLTEINGNNYFIEVTSPTTFDLYLDSQLKVSIDSSEWAVFDISNITKATTAVVTTTSDHNYVDGQPVLLSGVVGMTDIISATPYYVSVVNNTTVNLYTDAALTVGVDSSGFDDYVGLGTLAGDYISDGDVASAPNGIVTGNYVNGGTIAGGSVLGTTSTGGGNMVLSGEPNVVINSLIVEDLNENYILISGPGGAVEYHQDLVYDKSSFIINPLNPALSYDYDRFRVDVASGDVYVGGDLWDVDPTGTLPPLKFATQQWVANDFLTFIARPLWQVDDNITLIDAKNYADEQDLTLLASANQYTDDAIIDLIDGAPDDLNTLDKLAFSINDDPQFYSKVLFKEDFSVSEETTPAAYGETSTLTYDSSAGGLSFTPAVSIGSVSETAPANNQVLRWNESNIEWEPDDLINVTSSAPTDNPQEGDLWVDTANLQLYVYSGGAWIPITPAIPPGGGEYIGHGDISVTQETAAAAGTLVYYSSQTTVGSVTYPAGTIVYTPPDLTQYATGQLLQTLTDAFNNHVSSLSTVATSGDYQDLVNTPVLATVATSGDFDDLSNKPTFATRLGQLTDVDNVVASDGQILKYNGTTGLWSPGTDLSSTGSGGTISFGDLSVSVNSPAGTGNLTYSGTNTPAGTFSYTPPDLSNFVTSTNISNVASSGDYNDLVNTPATLDDVNLTVPSEGEFLKFDGNNWVNSPIPGGLTYTDFSVTVSAPTNTPDLSYDNATGEFTYVPPDLSTFIALTDLSVVDNTAASTSAEYGGSLTYDNATGEFTYEPQDVSEFIKLDSLSVQTINIGAPSTLVLAPNIVAGIEYIIVNPGTTNFLLYGASDTNVGTTFTATASNLPALGSGKVFPTDPAFAGTPGSIVDAESVAIGQEYIVLTAGNTDWTQQGATSSDTGTIFTATAASAPGPGLGTAFPTQRDTSIPLGLSYDNTTGVFTFAEQTLVIQPYGDSSGSGTAGDGTLLGVDLTSAIAILAQQIIDGDNSVRAAIPIDLADLTDSTGLLFEYTDLEDTPVDILPNFDNIETGEILTVGSLTRTWDEGWFGKVVIATHGEQPSDTVTKALVLDSSGNLAQANADGSNVESFSTFSGSYDDLSDLPSLFNGDYNSLTNTPTIPTDVSDLGDSTGAISSGATAAISVGPNGAASGSGSLSYDSATGAFTYTPPDLSGFSTFDGAYSSLTGKPTIPSTISDLSDTTISNPAAGETLKYDATNSLWYNVRDVPQGVSVTVESASSGGNLQYYKTDTGSISAGTFVYTPPDLSGFSTFDGAYSSLTGKPSIPSTLTDLGISDGSANQILKTDGAGNFSFVDDSGGISLSDLSVSTNAASGNGSLSYDNSTGAFTFTPAETFSGSYADLTNKPTIPSTLTDLGITDGTNNQILKTDGNGTFSFDDAPQGFSGSYTDLTNKPTIPTDVSDLTDNSGNLDGADWNSITNIPSDLLQGSATQTISGSKRFNDNVELRFGNSDDVKIDYFSSTNTFNIELESAVNDVKITNNGSSIFQLIKSSGELTVTGDITAFGTISDIRQKENLQLIDGALKKVNQLNGYTFNYKTDANTKLTGVVAQEVQKVLPEAVYETINIENNEETLAVRHGNMVGILIEAIKELTERVEYLEDKLNNGDS
jgi:hypothetical protein